MARRFFLLLSLLSVFAVPLRAEDLPTIPIVKTWADLAAVKPLDLGHNITARVAIEATQAPSGAGVLLYALVEGLHDLPLRDASDQLGPLKVRVEAPAAAREVEILRAQQPDQRDWEGLALFCKAIPIPAEGAYTITISTLEDQKLAVATLRGEKTGYHAWTKFRSVRWNEIADAPQDGTLTGYLSYSDWQPAIPQFIGSDPLVIVTPDSLKRDSPLPRLLDHAAAAAKENPDLIAKTQALIRALSEDDFDTREKAMLELRALLPDAAPYLEKARSLAKDVESRNRLDVLVRIAHAGTLHLRASNVDSFLSFPAGLHASWPEDYFLVRWWVNGKPVILKDAEERPAFERVGQMRMAEVLRLRWKIDWTALGAKSGDRVAAQILYCPAGVMETQRPRAEALRPLLEFGQMPVLSNRSEFKLP